MSKPNAWSDQEVKDTVSTYFEMLQLEIEGAKYNKANYRRTLLEKLNNRTAGSVEFKMQNISGVLDDLHQQYIKGYKPMKNYQKSLKDAVIAFMENPD